MYDLATIFTESGNCVGQATRGWLTECAPKKNKQKVAILTYYRQVIKMI